MPFADGFATANFSQEKAAKLLMYAVPGGCVRNSKEILLRRNPRSCGENRRTKAAQTWKCASETRNL